MANGEGEATNLYVDGWRQGSIFRLELSVQAHILGQDGEPTLRNTRGGMWVIASQDCDLAGATHEGNDPLIEVRPVSNDDTADWGIRSRKLRLDETRCVLADGLPTRVSPALLSKFARVTREPPLAPGRAAALKTWLGLRFDGLPSQATSYRSRRTSPSEFADRRAALSAGLCTMSSCSSTSRPRHRALPYLRLWNETSTIAACGRGSLPWPRRCPQVSVSSSQSMSEQRMRRRSS